MKRLLLFIIVIAAAGTAAEAKVVTKPAAYQPEGFQLEGYQAMTMSKKISDPEC
jgi:hypothetical protein